MQIIQAFFILTTILTFCYGFERKVTSILNYGCSNCNSYDINLNYVRAVGDNDTIHQIWDFTRGKPTIMEAITNINTTLNITWLGKSPDEFEFSENPIYSFAMVLNTILEYNDVNDTGSFNPASSVERQFINTRYLKWNRTNFVQNPDLVSMELVGRGSGFGDNATIVIKLDYIPLLGYASGLPHLLHTANSTQLDLQLINLTTKYAKSRYALEVVIVSTDDMTDENQLDVRKGLDDEHTPGIFEVVEIITPMSRHHGNGGYIEYRPIAYTKPHRSIQDSTSVNTPSPRPFNHTKLARETTAKIFFERYHENILVENILLMYGANGDGFYKNANYTAWTCSIGYGLPPNEHFSLFVILVITLGLGIPLLILIAGGCFMYYRRRRTEEGIQTLKEDD